MHGQVQAARHRSADGAWFATSRGALLLVWAAFLLPRMLILLIQVTPTSDAAWYYEHAVELAAGMGYLRDGAPTAFWPPGQSLALALVFWWAGASTTAVGLFNLMFGALGGWLTLDLGRKIFSEGPARAGLLLLALYPNNIGYYPLALTEVFYTTLLLACCWLLVARTSLIALVLAGVLFGLASLVKAQTLAVIPLIYAIALFRGKEWLRRLPALLGRAVLLVLIAALTVLPWTVRNHDVLGHWVPISTNGGFTLLTGNNDSARGDYTPGDPVVTALQARDLGEVERDAEAKRLGAEWIAANPVRFAALAPLKLFRLWGPDGEALWNYEAGAPAFAKAPALFRAVRYANQAYYVLLMVGFAAAFALTLRKLWREGLRWLGLIDWWLLPYGVAVYASVIAVVFSGQSRFHYPVMPFVCLSCGWLIAELLIRNRRNDAT